MSYIIQADKAYKASRRAQAELQTIQRQTQHHLRRTPHYRALSCADNVFFWATDRVINASNERIHQLSQSS